MKDKLTKEDVAKLKELKAKILKDKKPIRK
jgi:hypothetical protein